MKEEKDLSEELRKVLQFDAAAIEGIVDNNPKPNTGITTREEIITQIDNWVACYIGPTFEFRQHQKETIINVIENIVLTKKNHNHVIEAPTGSGKSLIVIISAGVLAEYYNIWSYILCSDLYLWDQYAKFIENKRLPKFGMLKGQTGNYTCEQNHEDMRNAECRLAGLSWATMFDSESARKLGYPCAAKCEYVKARRKAVKSPVVLMTYQLFFYMINVVTKQYNGKNKLTNRPVIFCDECHNIPELIQGKMTPVIKRSDLDKLIEIYDYMYEKQQVAGFFSDDIGLSDDEEMPNVEELLGTRKNFINTLDEIYEKSCDEKSNTLEDYKIVEQYLDILVSIKEITDFICHQIAKAKQQNTPVSDTERKMFKLSTHFQNIACHWNDFNNAITYTSKEYLIKQISDPDLNNDRTITFNCTKEDWMVYNYLLAQADWRVMLSATVGGKTPYEENTGMRFTEDGECMMEYIPSTFDFSKSPVIFLNRHKMSFRDKNVSLEKLKPIVNSICNQFKGQKGIIQTGTYAIAQNLYFSAPPEVQKRMLFYTGSKEKAAIIKKHKQSDDTILIGPTLCEGVDLPDDLCRFIVIMKMPYPTMTDKLVAAKMKLFPLWYNSKTSNAIIQGIGRGVRNATDYCTTYILDGCFFNLYVNTKEQYSSELQERIKLYN